MKAAAPYVSSHGWHTGIIVPRAAAMASGAWPAGVAERDFAGCAWLELGWGDRKFYMAEHPGVAMAVGAALVPGRSVLHVVGLRGGSRAAVGTGIIRLQESFLCRPRPVLEPKAMPNSTVCLSLPSLDG